MHMPSTIGAVLGAACQNQFDTPAAIQRLDISLKHPKFVQAQDCNYIQR